MGEAELGAVRLGPANAAAPKPRPAFRIKVRRDEAEWDGWWLITELVKVERVVACESTEVGASEPKKAINALFCKRTEVTL